MNHSQRSTHGPRPTGIKSKQPGTIGTSAGSRSGAMAYPAGSLSSAVRHRSVGGLSLVYKMEMWCSELTMVGFRLRESVHHGQNLRFAFDSADTIACATADGAIKHFGGGLAFIACFGDKPDWAAPPRHVPLSDVLLHESYALVSPEEWHRHCVDLVLHHRERRCAHPPAGVRRIVGGTGYSTRSAIGRGPRRGRRGRCW
jgi:hypothetical protein